MSIELISQLFSFSHLKSHISLSKTSIKKKLYKESVSYKKDFRSDTHYKRFDDLSKNFNFSAGVNSCFQELSYSFSNFAL